MSFTVDAMLQTLSDSWDVRRPRLRGASAALVVLGWWAFVCGCRQERGTRERRASGARTPAHIPLAQRSDGCGKAAAHDAHEVELDVNGERRSYYLVPPDTYDPAHAHALVVGLHGSGSNGQQFRRTLDLEPLAQNAVFAYPDGLRVGDATGWVLDPSGRDAVFIERMIAEVEGELCIDRNAVFAVGFSYGGWMANTLGCAGSGTVRAIASIAGGGPRDACSGTTSALIVHGAGDFDEPMGSGESSRDHWKRADGCSDVTAPWGGAGCIEFVGCAAGLSLVYCRHAGGHEIPDAYRGPIWRFFARAGSGR